MNILDNILYTVSDLDAAKALHATILDAQPHTDTPYYVGFEIAGVEIGLTPTRSEEAPGAIAHIRVPDLDAAIQRALDAGAALLGEPREVGDGNRVATVGGADGTTLGLIQRA